MFSPLLLLAPILVACTALAPAQDAQLKDPQSEASPAESQDPQSPVPAENTAQEVAAEEGASVEAAPDQASAPWTSLFVDPLYLGEQPATRSLRHVVILHKDVPEAPKSVTRTEEEALEIASGLFEQLEAGADFSDVARRYSQAPSSKSGGVLGTFSRGMLGAEFDDFLFSAEVGDQGGPFSVLSGVHLLKRIDTFAAAKQILIKGDDEAARARCMELLARARAGEDFSELATQFSEDAATAARGGQLAIFERGPFDSLLKAAAFEAQVGEVVGPVRTPYGFHLVQRVPVSELDPNLMDLTWVRGRAILLSFEGAPDFPVYVDRAETEAAALIHELYERILAGEEMADLAAEHNDDMTGKERGGDLGWLHRRTPRLAPVINQLFLKPVGTLLEPIRVPQGWALLRREG